MIKKIPLIILSGLLLACGSDAQQDDVAVQQDLSMEVAADANLPDLNVPEDVLPDLTPVDDVSPDLAIPQETKETAPFDIHETKAEAEVYVEEVFVEEIHDAEVFESEIFVEEVIPEAEVFVEEISQPETVEEEVVAEVTTEDVAPDVIPIAEYKTVSPEELNQMLQDNEDFLLINVHIPYGGEIPGTDLHVPYNDIPALEGALGYDLGTKAVLYCFSGPMSKWAMDDLIDLGYWNLLDLPAAMMGWQGAGYPLD